jgi:hypothetical protein
MMERNHLLRWVIGLTVVALAAWWWTRNMVYAPTAVPNMNSPAHKNLRLAATRLLQRFGHPVQEVQTLAFPAVRTLHKGVLLMPAHSNADPTLAARLLEWVRQGNTLIYLPGSTGRVEWGRKASHYHIHDYGEDRLAAHFRVAKIGCGQLPPACPARPRAENAEGDEPDEVEAADAGATDGKASDGTATDGNAADGKEGSGEQGDAAHAEVSGDDGVPAEDSEGEADSASDGTGEEKQGGQPAPRADSGDESDEATPAARAGQPARKGKSRPARDRTQEKTSSRPPGMDYPLAFTSTHAALLTLRNGPAPQWNDATGQVLRVYREQQGHVVFLTHDPFDNEQLPVLDHGELLLVLARLGGPKSTVTIARHIERTSWLDYLWQECRPLMLALCALLLAWLWGASRRFGPMLPVPPTARRALIEHVDASGRWLWKLAAGRERLLQAVRQRTLVQLQRRHAALMRLERDECHARLAEMCKLSVTRIRSALEGDAASDPIEFARQISTLQQLRAHHERAHRQRHHDQR